MLILNGTLECEWFIWSNIRCVTCFTNISILVGENVCHSARVRSEEWKSQMTIFIISKALQECNRSCVLASERTQAIFFPFWAVDQIRSSHLNGKLYWLKWQCQLMRFVLCEISDIFILHIAASQLVSFRFDVYIYVWNVCRVDF